MTVQNALEEMKERAFAPAFQKYLFDTYKVLAQTDFSEEEKDYTAAEDYFTTTLEQSENEILRQIKTNYEAKLRYASRYAFNAGLYSGFVQHFSNQDLVVDITMSTPSSPRSFTLESAVMYCWPMIFREPFPTTPALKAGDGLVSTAIRSRLSTKRLLFRFFQRSRNPLRSVL